MNLIEEAILMGYIGSDDTLTEEQKREVEQYNQMCLKSIREERERRIKEKCINK